MSKALEKEFLMQVKQATGGGEFNPSGRYWSLSSAKFKASKADSLIPAGFWDWRDNCC